MLKVTCGNGTRRNNDGNDDNDRDDNNDVYHCLFSAAKVKRSRLIRPQAFGGTTCTGFFRPRGGGVETCSESEVCGNDVFGW